MRWAKHVEYLLNMTKYLVFISHKIFKIMPSQILLMLYYNNKCSNIKNITFTVIIWLKSVLAKLIRNKLMTKPELLNFCSNPVTRTIRHATVQTPSTYPEWIRVTYLICSQFIGIFKLSEIRSYITPAKYVDIYSFSPHFLFPPRIWTGGSYCQPIS